MGVGRDELRIQGTHETLTPKGPGILLSFRLKSAQLTRKQCKKWEIYLWGKQQNQLSYPDRYQARAVTGDSYYFQWKEFRQLANSPGQKQQEPSPRLLPKANIKSQRWSDRQFLLVYFHDAENLLVMTINPSGKPYKSHIKIRFVAHRPSELVITPASANQCLERTAKTQEITKHLTSALKKHCCHFLK